jgi:hypothetical protein
MAKKNLRRKPPPDSKLKPAGTETAKATMPKRKYLIAKKPADKRNTQLGKRTAKPLAKQPGVKVLDVAVQHPVQTAMVKTANGRYLPEAGPILVSRPLISSSAMRRNLAAQSMLAAKLPHFVWNLTDPEAYSYDGMDKFYREFRRDALVRSCICALAFYSTNKGFDTVIEPSEMMDVDDAADFVKQD